VINSSSSSNFAGTPITNTAAATYISAFSTPASSNASNAQQSSASTSGQNFRVVGVPSRVFPGLGLRLVPTNTSLNASINAKY
jgi:hypothetical protein